METLDKFTELETKYRVAPDVQHKFKVLMEQIGYEDFIYAEGPDTYYTRPDVLFARYRRAITEKRAELTIKEKPEGAKNNLIRKETNLRVDKNADETVHEFLSMLGFIKNFKIRKDCHIYKMKDKTTLVFYTVTNEKNDTSHFIEIEIDEDGVNTLTKEQAMDIIRSYEDKLAPLGITYRNRLNKSLFELYRRDDE